MKLQDDIPLTIYFEIGNTKKKIEDLLHITKGTLLTEYHLVISNLANSHIMFTKISCSLYI
ncbi:hypothetical protein ACT4UT_20370 [Bacillus sp. B-TM1]